MLFGATQWQQNRKNRHARFGVCLELQKNLLRHRAGAGFLHGNQERKGKTDLRKTVGATEVLSLRLYKF